MCHVLAVADEDHVLGPGDVLAAGQLVELSGVDRRLLEVEVLQPLETRNAITIASFTYTIPIDQDRPRIRRQKLQARVLARRASLTDVRE